MVKKYQGPPSFCCQAAPLVGGSSQGKKKKQGSAGKGKKAKYGKVHFVTTASGPAPVVHSIMHFMPQGMEQWLAVSEPVTSSFGQGPWPSFNNAMMMADHLQVLRTQRTVQRLEQSLLGGSLIPPSCLPLLRKRRQVCRHHHHRYCTQLLLWSIWMTHHHLWHPLLSTAAQHPRKGLSLCHPLIGLAMEDVPSLVSTTPLWQWEPTSLLGCTQRRTASPGETAAPYLAMMSLAVCQASMI